MTEIRDPMPLAAELITLIVEQTAPRTAALEERITDVMAYMNGVERPNLHTLSHIRRVLTGVFDDSPPAAAGPPDEAEKLRDMFVRRWNCYVVSTGYNNGARCGPGDPHGDHWNCGYLWTASLTDKQARYLGFTTGEDTPS